MNKQRLMMSLVLAMTATAHAMPPDVQTKYPLPLNSDSSDVAHNEKAAQGNQSFAGQAANTTQCPDACRSLNNQPSVISAADNTGTTTRDSMGQSRTPTTSTSSNSSSSYGANNDNRAQGNQPSTVSAVGNTGTTTRESLGQPRTPTTSTSSNSSSSYGTNNDNRAQGNQSSAASAADNTGKNTRDSTGQSITPLNQSNSSAELKITSDIRSALVDDKSLSTNAHNVKVITTNGSITLRGPVRNTQERDRVLAIVKKFAGRYSINNYLEVTTR